MSSFTRILETNMSKNVDSEALVVLRRNSRRPVWFGLFWRAAIIVGLIGFLVLFHWLERDGLKDSHDGHVSFLDVIYFTMISATTTGYGDIVPIADHTRLFDALVVTPIRIMFLLIFIGTTYLFVARRSWERWQMKRIQHDLKNHIVVTGFGTQNSRAVAELIAAGSQPEDIVVIDMDEERLVRAQALGCNVLNADATRDQSLRVVQIERARSMIISAGRDDTSILICLTARHLAPRLRISISVRVQDNEIPARRAGADVVINPLDFAGLLLATADGGEHIADYLSDLASAKGKVQLIQREVEPQEVGRSLKQLSQGLGLRIIRNGVPYGFWRPQVAALEPGDVIMEIRPTINEP